MLTKPSVKQFSHGLPYSICFIRGHVKCPASRDGFEIPGADLQGHGASPQVVTPEASGYLSSLSQQHTLEMLTIVEIDRERYLVANAFGFTIRYDSPGVDPSDETEKLPACLIEATP